MPLTFKLDFYVNLLINDVLDKIADRIIKLTDFSLPHTITYSTITYALGPRSMIIYNKTRSYNKPD